MALALYRRHRRDCKAAHPEQLHTSEFDERKKGYRRCDCPIVASGTLNRKFRRQTTAQWEWESAKAVLALWEAAGRWDGHKPEPSQPARTPDTEPQRTTILEATEAYLARSKASGVTEATLSKYNTSIKQLRAYCDSRGYVMIDQLTVADMDRFYATWKDGKKAGAKKLARLKAFIRFCIKRKWIAEDITEDLRSQEGSSIPCAKSPFTDDEMKRIYAACDSFGPPVPPGPGHRDWSGEDVKDFVLLSVYTGLRISDVATFDITTRLHGNDVFLRMHKTQKEMSTWIPDWLVARLRAREKQHGPLIFKTGSSTVMRTMAELWRVKIKKIFKQAGPWAKDRKPSPHLFRHTFVRILLEHGVPIADVAELAGDTEETIRKHYSKWTIGRQDRLRGILREAFDDKPRPQLVPIRGSRK